MRNKLAVLAIAVLSVTLAAVVSVSARSKSAAGPIAIAQPVGAGAPSAVQAHTLQKTYVVQAPASGISLATGFNNLDAPLTITCPAAGCTIAADFTVQMSGTAGELWAVCSLVDSTFMGPACPYLGPLAGGYQAGAFSENSGHLTAGAHTVQSQIYTSSGGTLGAWTINYRQYKP